MPFNAKMSIIIYIQQYINTTMEHIENNITNSLRFEIFTNKEWVPGKEGVEFKQLDKVVKDVIYHNVKEIILEYTNKVYISVSMLDRWEEETSINLQFDLVNCTLRDGSDLLETFNKFQKNVTQLMYDEVIAYEPTGFLKVNKTLYDNLGEGFSNKL